MAVTAGARPSRQPTSKLPPPPSRTDTLAALLDRTGRGVVPIRREFVQRGHGRDTVPGPLAGLLTAHDERGLDAYLLAHALASAEPYTCTLPASAWARALGIEGSPASITPAVSKVMRRLDEEHDLIERTHSKRRLVVTLLREDGSRDPYQHPYKNKERHLRLPDTYWRDGWMNRLSLVGKTMLLVALERPDGFDLPFKRAPRWYGLSADSASSGLRELHTHKLVDVEHTWVRDARSDTGWAPKYTYTLTGPFSTVAQEEAAGRPPATRAGGDLDEENSAGDQKHINAEEDTEAAPAASPTDHNGSDGGGTR
jgi:hypothetical protein